MAGESEEALMAAYAHGDAAAFEQLFERTAPLVRRLLLKNGCSEDVASDLVQQTFLQLHRARLDFDPSRALRPWLFTIAMNLLRGHYRNTGRRPEVPLTLDGTSDPGADPIGAGQLEDRELAERVRTAVRALPENQRIVIEMHWFEERPFPEIAAALGIGLSAVKVRAHRGYQRLKTLLQPSEEVA